MLLEGEATVCERNRLQVEKAHKMLYIASTWRVHNRALNTPITDEDQDTSFADLLKNYEEQHQLQQ